MTRVIALDSESYFAADYSLSGTKSLTTEEYVSDPRYKLHCWAATDCKTLLPVAFADIDFDRDGIVFHHAQLDAAVLAWHFDIRPRIIFDTLSMSHALYPHERRHSLEALATFFDLPAKMMPYNLFKGLRDLPPHIARQVADGCQHDAWLTAQVFRRLVPYFGALDLWVIDQTIRMFSEPAIEGDVDTFLKLAADERTKKNALLNRLGVTEQDLQSSAKFQEILESWGYECPMKPSPKKKDVLIPALAKNDYGMQALVDSEDDDVAMLARARLAVKSTIDETRASRYAAIAARGPMPVYLAYASAHTMRYGGGDRTNFQNLRRGGGLRRGLRAPKGHKLLVGDLSQIEARVLNCHARQWDTLDKLCCGTVYLENATRFHGYPCTKFDENGDSTPEYNLGKKMELAPGYGMGAFAFQRLCWADGRLRLAMGESQSAIDMYRGGHKLVVRHWQFGDRLLRRFANKMPGEINWGPLTVRNGWVGLPGRVGLDYTELNFVNDEYILSTRRGPRKLYGAKLVQNVTEYLAWLTLCEIAYRVGVRSAALKLGMRWVLQVHDELVYVVPEERAQSAEAVLREEMTRRLAWWPELPLGAEVALTDIYEK